MKMIKMKPIFLVCVGLVFLNPVFAQEKIELTKKDSIISSSWMFGVGINIVDDSGDVFDQLLKVDSQWNSALYPSRISIGKYFNNGLGVEAIGTYNKYKVGKVIDGVINDTEKEYYAIDSRLSYDLNKLIGQTGWFDPYVGVGLGYTKANDLGRGTYNAIVGFRTWFSDRIGLDFNSSGKWAMNKTDGVTNHIQHAVGLVYQFGIEKDLSKKGKEKLALIEAIEKENQRKNDSIANAEKEAMLLAERLQKEKEQAALAKAEQDKQNELKRRKTLEDQIKGLGLVYFDFNSSNLNESSKNVLSKLAAIINENETIVIEISSYTDSRGNAEYNKMLSAKRVKHTINYLIEKKGVDAKKIIERSFGEDVLVNECKDGVYCSEKKHRDNRRSEFKLINI
jgi:outer membrane protein OmpA-like peptidoglycan-associated protein/outer membrane protein W